MYYSVWSIFLSCVIRLASLLLAWVLSMSHNFKDVIVTKNLRATALQEIVVCCRHIHLQSKPSCLLRAAVNVVSVYFDRHLLGIMAENVFPL